MYSILATKRVDKKLVHLHQNDKKKAFKVFTKLKSNPLPKGVNLKKMKKSGKNYRIRIGNIRIIYNFNPQKKQIIITDIGYRGNIY